MTKALRLCVCVSVTLTAFARPAAADWHFTPFIGVTIGGTSTFFGSANLTTGQKPYARKDLVVGGAVSRIGTGLVGFEGIFALVPGIVDPHEQALLDSIITESRSIALMGNVVLTTPRAWNEHGLRPFVSGGVGLLHFAQDDLRHVFPVRRNVTGYNVGGGAVGFVSDRTGLRFEARRFGHLKSAESTGLSIGRETLNYWTASVGVVLRYGAGAPTRRNVRTR